MSFFSRIVSPFKESATEAAVSAAGNATSVLTGVVGGTAMMALGGVSIGQAVGDPTAGPSARVCLGVGGACEVVSGVCYLGSAASRCWTPPAGVFLGGFGAFFHCLGRGLVIYGDSTPV